MKLMLLYTLAFMGGVFLAVQAGFNTQLSTFLKQPVLAVISTSVASAFFGSILIIFIGKSSLPLSALREIPIHLWFIGGLFSMAGISLYFYTIPQLGIARMITLGLFGQIIFSLIAGKFGWLNLPVEPITFRRIAGVAAMLLGILLINTK
ncbi:MAG TPA: EamA-like transporter family protein [Microscillaceae bacterium]|nr:EamA-like transporter family protein [Microscillaceae bacterium]